MLRFGLPEHYEPHVRAWRDNPKASSGDWNPRISAKAAIIMSSLAESIEQASRSFTGQLVQPADETERGIAWARDTFSALTPYRGPMRYLNYLEAVAVNILPLADGTA